MTVKEIAEKFGFDFADKELLKKEIEKMYEILENISERIEYLERRIG